MSSTSMKDFKIEKVLGKGSFGSVYLVTRKEDNKIYALKSVTMEKLNKKEQENSVNEVRILASVNHPNVIGYKETFWDDQNNTLNIVMEYADDGDLETKIKKMKKNCGFFDEQLIWSYSIQMIEGLKALHDKKIMHRDLKSANIFLVKNKRQCKIGDMNVSKVIKEKVLRTQTGTPYYASPEVWNDKPYSYKSDLWSIGCVIYELCALCPPFRGKDLDELYINVCKGKVERINKVYSDSLWKMILMLLQVDVNKRVNCDQFLNHPLIIKKIRELKEKSIEYKDLEDNKNINDGYLLNTINFKELGDIKAQLPKRKNYENTNNNIDEKRSYFESKNNKNLELNKNELIDIYKNNHYINLDKNILNNNNNYKSNKINNLNINNKDINDNKKIYNNENNIINNNDNFNIINDKIINKYNDILEELKKKYNLNNNNNIQTNMKNKSPNLNYDNYNLAQNILKTDIAESNTNFDKISNLNNEKDKIKIKQDIEFKYENKNLKNIDFGDKINFNEKILQLQKEKNKIIEKQKERQNKTIEEQIDDYKKLLDKINIKKEQFELKNINNNINNNLNNINSYDYKIKNGIQNQNKIKIEKIENKNNNILNTMNNNQILKNKKNIISPPKILKVYNLNTNNNIKGDLRLNIDYKYLPITNINNKKIKYHTKKSSKPLLVKKNILINDFKERSQSPLFINNNKISLSKNLENKNKIQYNNISKDNIKINRTNIQRNSLLNYMPTEYISSLSIKNFVDSLQNNVSSIIKNSNGNNIKRINKRIVTINKKRKKNIINNNNNNTNISRRYININSLKRKNKNITINNNLNIFDIKNISNQYSNYPINNINYDHNTNFNNFNLTNINEPDVKKRKNILNERMKLPIDNELKNYLKKYNSNTIINNNNNKYSIINNIKYNEHKTNNSFNFINQLPIKKHSFLRNSKKINVRSNSYRIPEHEKNFINNKRYIDQKSNLTESEILISNHLKFKNSKNNFPKFANLSLFSNRLKKIGISNNNATKSFLHNIKENNENNLFSNLNNSNIISGRYYLNTQDELKCQKIFNNFYSFNGVSASNLPIKVINIFNNK